jgi:FkbM family methyltransferase
LDLGANVGYSSAYLLSCFPNATVVAIEPDPDNLEVCRENLAAYGERAKVVRGGVWSKRARLKLSREAGAGRDWAVQVRESTDTEDKATVEAWDVPSLLQLAGETQIDLLKCDIERSEIEVFGPTSAAWLSQVRNICIELHGPDCKQVFLDALKDFDYDITTFGELTICRNLHRKPMAGEIHE